MFHHHRLHHLPIAIACATLAFSCHAVAAPDCRVQRTDDVVIEMCLLAGAMMQHDMYVLKADNTTILALVDDFAENVTVEHTIPDGLSMEFPLSRQGGKTVTIKGGCTPESKDGAEVARVCNFHWGQRHIVKDVRFTF